MLNHKIIDLVESNNLGTFLHLISLFTLPVYWELPEVEGRVVPEGGGVVVQVAHLSSGEVLL